MNIAKFIQENEFPYDTSLETKIGNVEKLLKKKIISSQFAEVLIKFLLKKEIIDIVKHDIDHIFHNHDKKDKWFFVNLNKKRTNYIYG